MSWLTKLIIALGWANRPVPVAPFRLNILVLGTAGPLTGADVNVANVVKGVTGADGGLAVDIPVGVPSTTISAWFSGYLLWERSVASNSGSLTITLTPVVPPPPPFKPLPRILRAGQHFVLDTGGRYSAIQNSDFNLLNRWQHGEDITPILRQRCDLGFNMLRVWTKFVIDNIGAFTDIDYARVGAFLDLCATFDLYVEFTAYTGYITQGQSEDKTHFGKLCDAVRGCTNVLIELVNEEDIAVNSIDLAAYVKPEGVFASHGSNGSQAQPVTPYWDYCTFHANGAPEEQRKIGHNAMEIWSGPTLTNETSRFPEVGMWAQHSDETDADWHARIQRLAYDSAVGAALLCAGCCFHSVQGKTSVLFDAAHVEAAMALVAGAKSVDLVCQDGPYIHRQDLEGTTYLRVYERPVEGHNGLGYIRP